MIWEQVQRDINAGDGIIVWAVPSRTLDLCLDCSCWHQGKSQ